MKPGAGRRQDAEGLLVIGISELSLFINHLAQILQPDLRPKVSGHVPARRSPSIPTIGCKPKSQWFRRRSQDLCPFAAQEEIGFPARLLIDQRLAGITGHSAGGNRLGFHQAFACCAGAARDSYQWPGRSWVYRRLAQCAIEFGSSVKVKKRLSAPGLVACARLLTS